jgi:hypothetical protein
MNRIAHEKVFDMVELQLALQGSFISTVANVWPRTTCPTTTSLWRKAAG